jgi:hypothetical protein
MRRTAYGQRDPPEGGCCLPWPLALTERTRIATREVALNPIAFSSGGAKPSEISDATVEIYQARLNDFEPLHEIPRASHVADAFGQIPVNGSAASGFAQALRADEEKSRTRRRNQ